MERLVDPLTTVDAKLWADEFMKVKARLGEQEFDHAMMLGWFANAIMQGYDEGQRRAKADAQATVEALQAQVKQLEHGLTTQADAADMWYDEFLRIRALNASPEINGICDRALDGIPRTVPVVQENHQLRQQVEALQRERDEQIRERERYFQLWTQATEERNEMRKERDEAQWPNVLAPAMYDNPDSGWKDTQVPDLTRIWGLAREVGYAVGLHGSLKRDMDLIAVPWAEEAVGNAELIDHLCKGLPAVRIGGPEHKPHKRVAVTLQMDGYFKPIDLSIVYRTTTLQAALDAERDRLRAALERVLEQWINGRKVKDGICMEVLVAAKAALTPAAPPLTPNEATE